MSFEIKYDRDGSVLPGQKPPVVEESAPETIEQPVEQSTTESESTDEDNIQNSPQEPQEAPVHNNDPVKESFKAMRERIEKAERRAAELEKAMQESQSSTKPTAEEDIDLTMDQDALVEGRHLSKVDLKIKRLENQLKQYQQQSALSSTEARLKQEYPDFDSVVSGENLNTLKAAYPELAHTLSSNNDMYSKAVSAYTLIKRLGIMPPEEMNRHEKQLIQKNAAKPKSLASISPQQGDSPLSKANAFANGLNDDLKKQLWKEMNDLRKDF